MQALKAVIRPVLSKELKTLRAHQRFYRQGFRRQAVYRRCSRSGRSRCGGQGSDGGYPSRRLCSGRKRPPGLRPEQRGALQKKGEKSLVPIGKFAGKQTGSGKKGLCILQSKNVRVTSLPIHKAQVGGHPILLISTFPKGAFAQESGKKDLVTAKGGTVFLKYFSFLSEQKAGKGRGNAEVGRAL